MLFLLRPSSRLNRAMHRYPTNDLTSVKSFATGLTGLRLLSLCTEQERAVRPTEATRYKDLQPRGNLRLSH